MEADIRDWIVRYLAHEASRDELEEWLVPATWDIDDKTDPSTAALAFSAQLLLAERSQGHLSDAAFDAHLRRLASTVYLGPPEHRMTASSASTHQVPVTLQIAAAGTRSEAAPA